ncbi:MAG: hypothetical protein AB1635_21205 [Acidobacteriota bacterium]
MTHLKPDELVDAAEGTLEAGREAHLRACAGCRDQVDRLKAILREAASVDVPDPSPLFWDHLSARVRQAIEADATPSTSWVPVWLRWSVLGPMAALAVLVIVLADALPHPTPDAAQTATAAVAEAGVDDADGSGDAPWQFVADLAETINLEQAREAGLLAGPGAAERAFSVLDTAEQAELMRLLRAELGRPES